jgi:hypothetical protein
VAIERRCKTGGTIEQGPNAWCLGVADRPSSIAGLVSGLAAELAGALGGS